MNLYNLDIPKFNHILLMIIACNSSFRASLVNSKIKIAIIIFSKLYSHLETPVGEVTYVAARIHGHGFGTLVLYAPDLLYYFI